MTFSKVSAFLSARPPETTRDATPRSGLSDFAIVVLICSVGGSDTCADSTALTSTLSPSVSCEEAGGKAVPLTVKNLILTSAGARMVEMAFPA